MANYRSGDILLNGSAEEVYSKLSNLENLKSLLEKVPADRLPEDQRRALESLEVTQDSITFPGGPVGSLTLKMTEKVAPEFIKLEAENSPVPLSLSMHIIKEGATQSKGYVDIDVAIPAMLKPMVGGQIQKMADQFGDMLKTMTFA